jgi:2-polyprenyl-3-methyl-5-hydroxy-6-metoxy-1,4-benzoquinol methylase
MCKICVQFDQIKADKFAGQMLQYLNNSALTLMISVGHRTRLFDVMAGLKYVSSHELAKVSNMNERYVREWLGAMVTGKIVEYDSATSTYHLPDEHAAFLTRKAASDNIALFAQYIPVLGGVEDRIVACFKHGGGVSYDEYGRFHEVMAEDSGQSVLSSLSTHVLPLIPGLTERLTHGIRVLDIGCGRGKAMLHLAAQYPRSTFHGVDLCAEPVEQANAEVETLGLQNVVFEQQDLTHYTFSAKYDLITAFDAIHDQARPDHVLSSVYRALDTDGHFLMQDIDGSSHVQNNMEHPLGTLLYTISCMHCMTVSLAQDGMGLGAMWGTERAGELLRNTGFTDITIERLEHDIQNCYYIVRK